MKKLIYFYDCLMWGTAITTVGRCRYLTRHFDVEYVTTSLLQKEHVFSLYNDLVASGVSVRFLPEYKGQTDAERIESYLIQERPDIVIVPTTKPICRLFASMAKALDVPLVCAELRDQLFFKKELADYMYLRDVPHAIFPNSEHNTKLTKELFPSKFISSVVNGVSEEQVTKETANKNPFASYIADGDVVITCVAQLHYQKNHLMLIRAMSEVRNRYNNVKLFLVGLDATMGAYLRKCVGERGLEDCIIFLGERDDIRAVLDHSDIFCLTSHFEGMPKTLLEAMGRSLPVVTTAVSGIDEIIEDGTNGFKVLCDDHQGCAERIEQLLNDKKLRKSLGESAQRSVLEKYSIEKITESYAKTLKTIFDKDGGSCTDSKLQDFAHYEKCVSKNVMQLFEEGKCDLSRFYSEPLMLFDFCIRCVAACKESIPHLFEHVEHVASHPGVRTYLWQARDQELLKNCLIAVPAIRAYAEECDFQCGVIDVVINIVHHSVEVAFENKALAFYNAGSRCEEMQFFDVAIGYFKHVLACSAQSEIEAGSYFHLGRIAFIQERLDQAEECMIETLRLNPLHAEAERIRKDIKTKQVVK